MKIILFFLLSLPLYAKAWNATPSYQVQSMASDFYPEGERHELGLTLSGEAYALQQGLAKNTMFGLDEKLWSAELQYKRLSMMRFWGGVGFGKDAVSSAQSKFSAGASWQFLARVNGVMDIGYRQFRSADVTMFSFGVDLELPRGVLLIPRVMLNNTDFHTGNGGQTASWFLKAILPYLAMRPYVFYGDGRELDSQLGGLLTATIRTTSYGAGISTGDYLPVNIGIDYENRSLKDLNRDYQLWSVNVAKGF